MLDHMSFRVADMARSKAFCSAALAPLGYALHYEKDFDGTFVVGFGQAGVAADGSTKIDTWLVAGPVPNAPAGPSTGCHLAWLAPSRPAVDAFHAAALAAGRQDHGGPGVRPRYHAHYYGAFVIDPDGNNVEAACHDPA